MPCPYKIHVPRETSQVVSVKCAKMPKVKKGIELQF